MSHSNPFQPWKLHPPNLFNSSGNFMQYHSIAPPPPPSLQNYSTLHPQNPIGIEQVSTSTPTLAATSTNNLNNNINNSSSSIKGGPNYHKINSIDKMVGLDSLVDEQIDNNHTTGGSGGGHLSREERNNKLRQFAEKNISDGAKQQIIHVLEKISQLSPIEKLLLYLRLPGGYPETDPLRQSQNPLGQRSEINHTINWVKSHLEHDDNVSIPKQDVYDDYVAYCGRVNIKPLSTADFGKVMKQVFPNIRPRRLGTRGNSRYCYAAMRKATKLDCPILPEIGNSTDVDSGGFDFQQHEKSWRTVKSWAEGLLSSEFDSLEQLAEHISKQNLNSPASISSRHLLQKKLLQKELKEKKKMNDNSLKKRRKKRRKLSSHSDNLQNTEENSNNKPDTDSPKSPDTIDTGSQNTQESNSGETKLRETSTQGTNKSNEHCDEQTTDKHVNRPKSADMIASSNNKKAKPINNTRFVQPQTSKTISKRASNLIKQMDNMNEDDADAEVSELGDNKIQQEQGTMRLKKIRLTPRTDFGNNNNSQHQINESGGMQTEQPVVTDIPLPLSRERMISLCTINKDELGCYLPDLDVDNEAEDNSQDQEVELMQIFQAEGKTNNHQQQLNHNINNFNNNNNNNNINNYEKIHNSSIPVLENYQLQLHNNSANSNNFQNNNNTDNHNQIRNQDLHQNKISELRHMLAQNLQTQQQQHIISNSNGSNNSAASTLAMLSQRHIEDDGNVLNHNNNSNNFQGYNYSRKTILPNNQRKNTFVPISSGPGLANPNFNNRQIETSPFVSPRATPLAKTKRNPNLPPLQIINHLSNPKTIPIIGASNTAFTRPNQFKQELPASAPSSPSLNGTYRYYSGQPANTASTIYHPESRSQSVPLHQQPIDEYPGYSSTCNSMNPTPVPSEYHDFEDQQSHLLEMFSSESGVVPNIKMEANELMSTDFLDSDEVTNIDMNDILPDNNKINSLISRSVPSTPLPSLHANNFSNSKNMKNQTLLNNNIHSNGINASKYPQSVPSTPIPGCAFRYTPPARDYLINGYNNQLDKNEQALVASSSFMNSGNEPNMENALDNFSTNSCQVTNSSDSLIESDIFNEMT
uniref:CSON011102 protein n=1 Tax=Culicoides sonorensis TaxID=179676 RepID=A0A336LZ03_CULSO